MNNDVKHEDGRVDTAGCCAAGLWFVPEVTAWLERKPDEAWASVQQSGVIRFAINPTYMPFDGLGSHGDFSALTWISPTRLRGDLARGLSSSLPVSIICMTFARGSGRSTISALPIDPAKFGTWRYSEPYFEAGQAMVTRLPSLRRLRKSRSLWSTVLTQTPPRAIWPVDVRALRSSTQNRAETLSRPW